MNLWGVCMEPHGPKGPEPPMEPSPLPAICQSCGMPMAKPDDFGTNADGSRNREYCRHCYGAGRFRDQSLTLGQMAEKLVSMAKKMGMSEQQARAHAEKVLPKLKRWRR